MAKTEIKPQLIFYTAVDQGDGSAAVEFFEAQDCIDLLADADPERYAIGEGGGSFTVVGEHDLEVRTMASVLAQTSGSDIDEFEDEEFEDDDAADD